MTDLKLKILDTFGDYIDIQAHVYTDEQTDENGGYFYTYYVNLNIKDTGNNECIGINLPIDAIIPLCEQLKKLVTYDPTDLQP